MGDGTRDGEPETTGAGLGSEDLIKRAREQARASGGEAQPAGHASPVEEGRSRAELPGEVPDTVLRGSIDVPSPIDLPSSKPRSRWRKLGVGLVVAVAGLSVLSNVVGDQDEEARAAYNDGVAMVDAERWEEAVSANTEAINLDPSDAGLLASAYSNRAFAYNELGQFDEAVADATAAINLEPDDEEILAIALLNRSLTHLELGRFEVAARDATSAINLEPEDVDALAGAFLNRSSARVQAGRFEDAATDATAAIALEPDETTEAEAYLMRSIAQGQLGRLEEAIDDTSIVIDRAPADVEVRARAYLFRAANLVDLGRQDDAESDLRVVVQLLPRNHELSMVATDLLADLTPRETVVSWTGTIEQSNPCNGERVEGSVDTTITVIPVDASVGSEAEITVELRGSLTGDLGNRYDISVTAASRVDPALSYTTFAGDEYEWVGRGGGEGSGGATNNAGFSGGDHRHTVWFEDGAPARHQHSWQPGSHRCREGSV